MARKYEDAVMHLNSLQTNAAILEAVRAAGKTLNLQSLPEFREYLSRIGLKPSDLNSLNVIHVSGTKGKGSTCAFTESILRRCEVTSGGVRRTLKTGLFTSPHLMEVRERFRINGVPMKKELFAKYFFEVWDELENTKHMATEGRQEKPNYFRFLSLVAFHAFLKEKVDVAIMEVGVGGEYDSTNVVEQPIVTGISSLGMDHMTVLGNTIAEIAWHKAGIIKISRPLFTSNQPEEALNVIRERFVELKGSEMRILDETDISKISNIKLGLAGKHQYSNAALAVSLCTSFVENQNRENFRFEGDLNHNIKEGLEKARWPGRAQVLHLDKYPGITWYLDGAHTPESLMVSKEWFHESLENRSKKTKRVLVFNCTHGRNGASLLSAFSKSDYDLVVFTTNEVYKVDSAALIKSDNDNRNEAKDTELKLQNLLKSIWIDLAENHDQRVEIVGAIEECVQVITEFQKDTTECDVLITGSLYLSKRSRSEARTAQSSPDLVPPSSPIRRDEDLAPFADSDEEVEDPQILANDPLDDEDEDDEGEDLFGPNLERDYRENQKLDRYDANELDDDEYDDLDMDARQIAEAKMRRRDRELARQQGRLPAAFMDDESDDEELQRPYQVRRRRVMVGDVDMDFDMDNEEAIALPVESLQEVRGPLNEWVTLDGPKATIKREFQHFLTSYTDEKGHSVYGERIRVMCEANGESLEVSYEHLQQSKAILAYYLANSPAEMLKIFDVVAFEVVLSGFEEYDRIKNEIHVRISDVPSDETLRDLRQSSLNTLVKVPGVVTRRTGVFPQLKYVKYDCVKCGSILGPYYQESSSEIKIGNCPDCQSKGPFNVNSEQTVYRNFQKITLQESPGSVPAGRLPRHKEVILLWDLVDSVRPGEEVEITGIYRNNFDMSLNMKNGFPVFSTVIEANHISKKQDEFASLRMTEEDVRQIRELSRDERIRERIIKSIAPSIYGHEEIKTALALAMFGGVFKNPQGKHRIRGDINVLLLGDPGTAKSQFLKYVEKTSHRAVYTTGQGASAVGLTASVHKDPITKEWTLEGGALVMADKGVCLIDEFDKMNDKDRTSIHEAMEQQSISISKAGIITTLQARCAVISAANPIRGRYNAAIPFSQNVELTEPILSRFDILCVVQDTADPIVDERLAAFVTSSHQRSHPDYNPNEADVMEDESLTQVDPDVIPQDLFRKYIMYAKDRVYPKIAEVDLDKIAELYSELRRESLIGGSIPITVRHIESLVRMSEAFARMQLREVVRQDDIEHSMAVMIKSFVSAQKNSVRKQLERSFSKYMRLDRDNYELLNHLLSQMVKAEQRLQSVRVHNNRLRTIEIDCEEFEDKARHMSIHNLRPFYESPLFRSSFTYNPQTRLITKVLERDDRE